MSVRREDPSDARGARDKLSLVVKSFRTPGRYRAISSYGIVSMMACGSARPVAVPGPVTPMASRPQVQLAVLPAESDVFPRAAQALSAQLSSARIRGVDVTSVSKVSLEVVQLSIECVDPTDVCYQAIGQSMSANRLLFARIEPDGGRRRLKVTVTLYDVDARSTTNTAQKVFASEDQAVAGAVDLVSEVVQ